MKDVKPNSASDPESRRPGGGGPGRRSSGPRRQRGYIERATAQGHSGHVGFAVAEKEGKVLLLSGNSANKVGLDYYPADRILAMRWPT